MVRSPTQAPSQIISRVLPARGRGGSSAGRRSEKADMRLAWRSCRRIPSATLGKKAHFCDRHHIAGATAALTSHSSGTAVWYSLSIIPPELSPANAGLLCVHTPAIGSIPEDRGTIQPLVGAMDGDKGMVHEQCTDPAACTGACFASQRPFEWTRLQETTSATAEF